MKKTSTKSGARKRRSSRSDGSAVFTGRGGYNYEKERAAKVFEVGKAYRVVGGTRGRFMTYIKLEAIKGEWNSSLFDVDIMLTQIRDAYCLQNDQALPRGGATNSP